jgi:hypothetical protein
MIHFDLKLFFPSVRSKLSFHTKLRCKRDKVTGMPHSSVGFIESQRFFHSLCLFGILFVRLKWKNQVGDI